MTVKLTKRPIRTLNPLSLIVALFLSDPPSLLQGLLLVIHVAVDIVFLWQ